MSEPASEVTGQGRGVREYLRESLLIGTAIVVPVLLTVLVLLIGL